MAISLQEATLIAMILNAIFFGIYTAVFIVTFYMILKDLQKGIARSVILSTSIAMYTIAVVFFIASAIRMKIGFIDESSLAFTYFENTHNPFYLIRDVLLVIQTLLGDGFLIFRLYVIWGDWRLLSVVALCWFGVAVTGSGALRAMASDSGSVYLTLNWTCAFFAMTFATNALCTLLISLRLWYLDRQTPVLVFSRQLRLKSVAGMILESGAIYSAFMLATLGTFLASSWAQYIVCDTVIHVIGIVFSVIIIRVHNPLGKAPITSVAVHVRRSTQLHDSDRHSLGLQETFNQKFIYQEGP